MGRKNRREKTYIKPLPKDLIRKSPKRMEIWFAELELNRRTSVQGGERPVLVVSNDTNNEFSPIVTVLPMTSKIKRPEMPTHTWLPDKCSMVLAEQITTIDKKCLRRKLGCCSDPEIIQQIEHSMREQLFGIKERAS